MKTKFYYFLFTFIFLFACSSLKKTSESSLKTSLETKTNLSKDIQLKVDSNVIDKTAINKEKIVEKTFDQVSSQAGEITGTLKTYDTSKMDPLTGVSPLLSELTFSNKTNSQKGKVGTVKTVEKSDIVTDIKTAVVKGLDVKIDSVSESKALVDQKVLTTKIRSSNWWWIVILVVGGVGVGTFLLKKFPLVVIWGKIKKWVKGRTPNP